MIKLYEHPEYQDKAEKWRAWKDLYDGDHKILRSPNYLWMHELEQQDILGKNGAKLRAIREQRSRYLNLIEPIVSRWVSFIFRKGAAIPEQYKTILGDELKNINGKGISLDSFIRWELGRNYILYGRPILQVDTSGAYARTLAEAKALGSRPFLNLINPLELRDWQVSDDMGRVGALDFARTEYRILEKRKSSRDEPKMATYSRELEIISPSRYLSTIYKAKNEKDQGAKREWDVVTSSEFESNGKLPIAWIDGDSYIKDSAEMQLLVFNYMSAESSQLNCQAFQRVFISGALSESSKPLIGEFLFNYLAEGATIQTIEPANTEPIKGAIATSIERCFKVAFNEINSLASDSKEAPSAETRKEMKDEFIALVQTAMGEIEDIINESMDQYLLLKGSKSVKEKITLDKNITIDDIDNEIAIWQAHIDSFKSIASLNKGVLKKHSAVFGLPNQEEIDKEIDAMPAEKVDSQSTKDGLLNQVLGNGNQGA